MGDNLTDTLTVRQLLQLDQYVIPLYQRNFAWEDREVEQLLRDVDENNNENYYIGTLVVSKEIKSQKPYYEVIDGQQRLTAISIIYSVLSIKANQGNRFPLNLSFESRERSSYALKLLREKGTLDSFEGASLGNFLLAVKTVDKFAKEVLHDDRESIQDYLEKFLRVSVFRVLLHELTDKNHYFEVMNNRGEQLEAHEIVKAKLMDSLDCERERTVFSIVWDACSDMNGRLDKNLGIREYLWGKTCEENPLELDSFEKIMERIPPETEKSEIEGESTRKASVLTIPSYKRVTPNPQEETRQDRLEEEYYSVIDFPNFLLQVLQIGGFKADVSLDAGKSLLEEFGCLKGGELPDAKRFLVCLLRLRLLFDMYIIKRKKTDRTVRGWKWAIERPKYQNNKWYVVNTFSKGDSDADEVDETAEDFSESKQMCMLQSMFFVTFRRDVYMRWLTKALEDVNLNPSGNTLLATLEQYSVDFIWESRPSDGIAKDEYRKALAIHHYVFNFLDYQLWYLYHCVVTGKNNTDIERFEELVRMINASRTSFQFFVFTRRNSIEHYLAQEKGKYDNIDPRVINDFGNLSLISHSLNSRLSNRECVEKKRYRDIHNPASLKYELMLAESEWNKETILRHGELMVSFLREKSKSKSEYYFEEWRLPEFSVPAKE